MASASVALKAKGRIGYLVECHEAKRSDYFNTTQHNGKKYMLSVYSSGKDMRVYADK